MENTQAIPIIVVFLSLIVLIFFTGSLGIGTERKVCKHNLNTEMDRLKEIACTSEEDQKTNDILNLKDFDCLENIYYENGNLCYKYTDNPDVFCQRLQCLGYSNIEFRGFDRGVVDRSIKKEYPVIITTNIISLYPCNGKIKTCTDFGEEECESHEGCGIVSSTANIPQNCRKVSRRPESCEELSEDKNKCIHEGCFWIGE